MTEVIELETTTYLGVGENCQWQFARQSTLENLFSIQLCLNNLYNLFCYSELMIIGIAGGTCTGKSTIARIIAPKLNAKVISVDDYFNDPNTFPTSYGHPDYDRADAIDFDQLMNDVSMADNNVIVEGFLLLTHSSLLKMMDKTFYIDIDSHTLVARRLVREPDTVREYITHTVRERHVQMVEPTAKKADVLLDGTKSIDELVDEILKYLGLN